MCSSTTAAAMKSCTSGVNIASQMVDATGSSRQPETVCYGLRQSTVALLQVQAIRRMRYMGNTCGDDALLTSRCHTACRLADPLQAHKHKTVNWSVYHI